MVLKPLRFRPYLKQTIWGGDKIARLKQMADAPEMIGESWEVSDVPGCESVCPDAGGLSVGQLVERYGERLLGRHVSAHCGQSFPLLVKLIDARQSLSVQVHPDDETARRLGQPCGKTEMWYLLDSDPDAFLYCGLRQEISREQYQQMVGNDTICDALARYQVSEGDVFFIPPGRIHTIGAGCLLVEIQQASDVTYRIYDYGRRDSQGRQRQLHTSEAMESIDFAVLPDYRTHYEVRPGQAVGLVSCPYFTTSLCDIARPVSIAQEPLDSFVILVALTGRLKVTTDGGSATLNSCETLLVAAENKTVTIEGRGRLLEVHC